MNDPSSAAPLPRPGPQPRSAPPGQHPGDRALQLAITEQVELVDRRVSQAQDLYAKERDDIRLAAAQLEPLQAALNLGSFLGTVGPASGKPQLRLLFDSPRGPVVLKIYGRRRPGEALVQQLWHRAGVRVVNVLAAGDDPTSWLLMPQLMLSPLVDGSFTEHQRITLTRELAGVLAAAHSAGADLAPRNLPDLQLLPDAIPHHLGVVLTALDRAGYRVRPDWKQKTGLLVSRRAPTLLHGDLAVGNVVRDAADGGLRLLDTCGYIGPGEFDAARWAARIGSAAQAELLLDTWLSVEKGLDPDLAHQLLGLELLMEAGVREIVKQEEGMAATVGDPITTELLMHADRYLNHSGKA